MNLTDTITLPELVWTITGVLAALGHIFVIRFFIRRIRDAKEVRRSRALVFLGMLTLSRHVLKLIAQMIAVTVGVYFMTQPPTNPVVPVTLAAALIAASFVTMEVILLLTSYIEVYAIQHVGGMADPPGALPGNVVR